MSAGHHNVEMPRGYLSSQQIERYTNRADLHKHPIFTAPISRDYDLPYLAGYSEAGDKIYLDRHLPERIPIERHGWRFIIRPDQFLRLHEEYEKALMDLLGLHYFLAHHIATSLERREVLAEGVPWDLYQDEMEAYVKHDELEKLESLPPDLDMAPYNAKPVNRRLIHRMRKAMGEEKLEKNDPAVEYSDDRGYPGRHCGPDADWPRNYCKFYGQFDCELVAGYIAPKGGCNKYKVAAESQAEKAEAEEYE